MFVVIKFQGRTHKLKYLYWYLFIFLSIGHIIIIYNFYPQIAHLVLQRLPFYGGFFFSFPTHYEFHHED
jgi:uncharacterized membrane protein YhaH (DUF805 family)